MWSQNNLNNFELRKTHFELMWSQNNLNNFELRKTHFNLMWSRINTKNFELRKAHGLAPISTRKLSRLPKQLNTYGPEGCF